jgi:hypothetical protein
MDFPMNFTTSRKIRWTKQDEEYLRKYASLKSTKEIAKELGRTYRALRMHAFVLKIRLTFNFQKPGQFHEFPCGCSGILPKTRGESNVFAKAGQNHRTRSWICRIFSILRSAEYEAKKRGYKPISSTHAEIRELMKSNKCWLCGNKLIWNFGRGQTPHLHHDHETGEILGFTHPRCNPRALQNEICRLKKRLDKLSRV